MVEGEERALKQWDFFHCPPWTEHVVVGAGTTPSVLLAVGRRFEGGYDAIEIRFPVEEAALRHGAGVTDELRSSRDVWPMLGFADGRYREGDLPALPPARAGPTEQVTELLLARCAVGSS